MFLDKSVSFTLRNKSFSMHSKIVIKQSQCIIKITSHVMSIVKVQSVAPVHFRVVRCHQMKKRHHMRLLSKVFTDLEKSLFLEVEISTMESLPLMHKGALCRPSSQTNCGMQRRSEPRTGRHCLEDQMADSGSLESAEVGSHGLSGPSETYKVRA